MHLRVKRELSSFGTVRHTRRYMQCGALALYSPTHRRACIPTRMASQPAGRRYICMWSTKRAHVRGVVSPGSGAPAFHLLLKFKHSCSDLGQLRPTTLTMSASTLFKRISQRAGSLRWRLIGGSSLQVQPGLARPTPLKPSGARKTLRFVSVLTASGAVAASAAYCAGQADSRMYLVQDVSSKTVSIQRAEEYHGTRFTISYVLKIALGVIYPERLTPRPASQ